MPSHQPVQIDEVPQRVKDAFAGLGRRLGAIYAEAAEKGLSDAVVHVLLLDDENAKVRVVDRAVYQKEFLTSNPTDSADPGSFFEKLNEPSPGGTGFWVVLQTVGERDEYLFRMAPITN